MFAPHPHNKPSGILAVHDSLIPIAHLSRSCGELRLTTPVIQVAWKIANRLPLDQEELLIVPSLTLKRGPRDWRVAPMVQGKLDSDSGVLAALDGLHKSGILNELAKEPSESVTKVDDILFSTYVRYQSLTLLWDLADGIHKGHRFGAPKPWVVEELAILGLISVHEPVADGSKGRPPAHLRINSWGRQFVECTRKYMGLDIPEEFSRMARRLSGNRHRGFTQTDLLAAGYLARGELVPERVVKKMSEHGKEELGKSYQVSFGG